MRRSFDRNRPLVVAVLCWLCLPAAGLVLADEPKTAANDTQVQALQKADRNDDAMLSVEEFIVGRGAADVAKRDFKLYDFNEDDVLDRDEFACVRTESKFDQPGVMPDYLTTVTTEAVAALDKAFGNWDQNPDQEINVGQFIATFVQELGNTALPANMREADPNNDRKVSRAEARRYIEIQLGIRRGDGKLLRMPNGNIVNYAVYLYADADRNDVLDRKEFLERTYGGANVAAEFTKLNSNGDEVISFEEFCHLPVRGFADPVLEFRRLDANLDARVDPLELLTRAPKWQRKLAEHTFPGFDFDQDGVLSLAEYRMTLIANKVLPWAAVLGDLDVDDFLSFTEFTFEQKQFPLLRLLYFHRLDVNGDKRLALDEYHFKLKLPLEFFSMNADGTGWQHFFKFDGRPNVGSPAVSPDGKTLAFDSHLRNDLSTNTIYVMDMVERKPREICVGMMPTWSPDGKRLACSRSGTNDTPSGIWTIGADAQNAQHIQPGWGAQWSPDGKRIAFDAGLEIKAYNVETKKFDVLLPANENPYRQIFWNMTWSPDSQQLCLKGLKADATQEMAILDPSATPKLKTRASSKQQIVADSAWHPGGERIIFAMRCPERSRTQLYEFNPQTDDPPKLVNGQDAARSNSSACWTPDGKRLIVVSVADSR
jgi:TolB protein